jgi:hypothetical protein
MHQARKSAMHLRTTRLSHGPHSPKRKSRRRSSSAYRRDGEHYLVELNLRDVRQLFNSLDPAPFREKDLDAAAEEYIVSAVRELGLRHASRLVIHLPTEGFNNESSASIVSAVRHYFDYRADHAADELKQTLVRGALSLIIGLAFLFTCLWLRQLLVRGSPQATDQIVTEGLLIMGWVALWRPIEIFLYDWWPIQHRKQVLGHIATMSIDVKSIPGPVRTQAPHRGSEHRGSEP